MTLIILQTSCASDFVISARLSVFNAFFHIWLNTALWFPAKTSVDENIAPFPF